MPVELTQPAPSTGCTLRVVYLDAAGATHQAVHCTTEDAAAFLPRAKIARAAMENYYQAVGCELISLQLMVETAAYVQDNIKDRRPSFLRMVASHGKRIYSEDVLVLARSAGVEPTAVFGEGP
jgi:hypothetical protein